MCFDKERRFEIETVLIEYKKEAAYNVASFVLIS